MSVTATAAARLAGKTVVITGASSGIGRSTALEFARTCPDKNLRLVLVARRFEAVQEVGRKIRDEVGEGVGVLPVRLDVASSEQVRGFIPGLPHEYRDIDVLVNNA